MKVDVKTIERIMENECLYKEMQMLMYFLRSEVDDCKSHVMDIKDCRKYGVKPEGLLSSVIGNYIALKEKQK